MPMENIKQQLSDVVHHWTAIAMITLFMFSVNPAPAVALNAAPTPKQVAIKEQQELIKQLQADVVALKGK